jgi:hypothetical protein
VELEALQVLGVDFNLPPDYAERDEECGLQSNNSTSSSSGN